MAQNVTVPANASNETCGRSLFWPFIRESSDCATAEKGKPSGTVAPATQSEPAVVPVASQPASANSTASAPAEGDASCHKGLFWPFVREPGDCASTADKGH
jgi:hypothetical protein